MHTWPVVLVGGVVVLAVAAQAGPPGAARERDALAERQATRPAHEMRGRRFGEGGPFRPWRTLPDAGPGGECLLGAARQVFRPAAADIGPLRAGEEQELLAFAQERQPRLHAALSALRERDPARFRERLADAAPRLRHLKRIHERSPKLGALLQTHMENTLATHRLLRTLRRPSGEAGVPAETVERLRELVGANVQLEITALELVAEHAQTQREELLNERVAALLEGDTGAEPPAPVLREHVTAYRAATTDAARQAARAALRAQLDRLLTEEHEILQARIVAMRAKAEEESQDRVQRYLGRMAESAPADGLDDASEERTE